MDTIGEIVPISDLRIRQSEVLARLADGPVFLTQRGRGTAVLLSLDQYNHLIERLVDLQDALDATEARAEEGVTEFDDYIAERNQRVPAAVET